MLGMFALAGLAGAAGMVDFVVSTSAVSSANSSIYSTSRMVYGLAQEGNAPMTFGKLSRSKVPANALLFSCMFLLAAVVLHYAGGSVSEAFTMVTTISALCFMFVWSIILISYIFFRRRRPQLHQESKFKVPGGAFMPWGGAWILWVELVGPELVKRYAAGPDAHPPIWFTLVGLGYVLVRSKPGHQTLRITHKQKVAAENAALKNRAAAKGTAGV